MSMLKKEEGDDLPEIHVDSNALVPNAGTPGK